MKTRYANFAQKQPGFPSTPHLKHRRPGSLPITLRIRMVHFPPSLRNAEGDICRNLLNARLNWEKLLKPL